MSNTDHLTHLGSNTIKYAYDRPNPLLLETFIAPFHSEIAGSVHIEAPEFTSLCPKTGQPDFAKIVIDYVPDKLCVESKSLKLYLGSFRMHGEFHESCVNRICHDLVTLLDPKSIKVVGEFTPRGGIPFWPTARWHQPRDSHSETHA